MTQKTFRPNRLGVQDYSLVNSRNLQDPIHVLFTDFPQLRIGEIHPHNFEKTGSGT